MFAKQEVRHTEPFKRCPLCQTLWQNRERFLSDHAVSLIGYQANPTFPERGAFLFQHRSAACNTTLALMVSLFSDLHQGDRHSELLFKTKTCEGRCLKIDDLTTCKQPCSAAYVRELISTLLSFQKKKEELR